ncbi:MAG: class II D-tagatose-bisphosphate aldolase non-catalytic subunit [Spirochaetia bacterium]
MIDSIVKQNKEKGQGALICICSAHPDVLRAAFSFLKKHPDANFSIESTVQQVNQEGGYTGMTPDQYVQNVMGYAQEFGITKERFILAGDHLGPNVWRNLPATQAMEKCLVLIEQYVKAGYKKLHLDPSMGCADDPTPLPVATIAHRTALMMQKAETVATEIYGHSRDLFYIVGTEVPVPGGAQEHEDHISVTPLKEVHETIDAMRQAMQNTGVAEVWARVRGVVVQPGVEFGDDFVFLYKPGQAAGLNKAIDTQQAVVYEAHSTDYQTTQSLRGLVQDHFAILKVGPELTFAWREALYALEMIEKSLPDIAQKSAVFETVEAQMRMAPGYWQPYYGGSEAEIRHKLVYSLSDRVRYYWTDEKIQERIAHLMKNLDNKLLYPVVSQFLPWVIERGEIEGHRDFDPRVILIWAVERVIDKYYRAQG